MFSKKQIQSGLLSLILMFTFIFNSVLPAEAQGEFVTSSRIGSGSSVYVFRKSRKAKKRNYSAKRRSKPKRTKKQRRRTRKKIVRQSRKVAKRNRFRRKIKKITPKQFKEIPVEKLKRQSKEEASKVLAGVGEYYVERDEFEQALGFLEEAVELDDNNTDAKHALSEVYTTVGDSTVEKAEEFAILAAKADKANNTADTKKYLTQKHFAEQKAEREFQRAIELDTKNSSAYASLGSFYDDQGNVALAKANYEKALELDSDLSKVKAPLGIIYYNEGRVADAERNLSEAIGAGEKNAEVQYFLGLLLYKENKNQRAKDALLASIALDNENAEAHYYLGAAINRLGDENRAIKEYLIATSLDPTFVNAWFDLGVAYYNKQMYDKAIEAFDKAISLNMKQTDEENRIFAESTANLAETYRQTEQYSKAISHYRNAVDLVKDPELYSTYGFVLVNENRWIDAVRMFEKVTQMKPDAVSYANLGWTHYQEAQYQASLNSTAKQRVSLQKAESALRTAVQKDDQFAVSYLNLGNTLYDLGEYKEAVSMLKKANQMRDEWVLATYSLAKAYQKNGDYKNAVKQYRNVIKLDKQSAEAYYGLGETELEKGGVNKARKVHKQLKKLNRFLANRLEKKIKKVEFSLGL